MISRVADHCFWLGCYLNRAEDTARLLSVTNSLWLDAELSAEQCWLPVIIVSGEQAQFAAMHAESAALEGSQLGEAVQEYMTWERDNMTSIVRSIGAARDNARSIRDVVSVEVWEIVNELYLWISSLEARATYDRDRYDFFRHVRRSVQLALGLARSTMLHETPHDFLSFGILLEQVGQTARVLDVHHHTFTTLPSTHEVVEVALWLSLLRACSGFEPFMKKHQGRVTEKAVAAFLLFDPAFPRSVAHCVESANERFHRIRPKDMPSLPGAATAERLEALTEFLKARAGEPLTHSLHELLTHVVDETAAICTSLSHELFGYGSPSPPQVPSGKEAPGHESISTQSQSQTTSG